MKIYIWGCGANGKRLYRILTMIGIKLDAFIDSDTQKHSINSCGIPCFGIENVIESKEEYLIIVSPADYESIIDILKVNNIKNYILGHEIVEKCKYLIPENGAKEDFKQLCPFNYYESPYPDYSEIYQNEKEIFDKKVIYDINFNKKRQLELLELMKNFDKPDCNKDGDSKNRYYADNLYFPVADATLLYYMMRILNPQKIIEIGSGFSTSVMLDVNENYFENRIQLLSIEPRPERLKKLLKTTDNLTIYETDVQNTSLKIFESLDANDILFVDSSHISKINSDVNYIFFEILPKLKQGVYIHFHDIFFPYEYPSRWIYGGRAYNEMYILRAFLMNNNAYSVQFGGRVIEDKLNIGHGGSFWIRKEKAND